MVRIEVNIDEELLEKLQEEARKRNYKSIQDLVLDILKSSINKRITIEATDKKKTFPPTLVNIHEINKFLRNGYSVIFNVKIDSAKGKIYVTKPCAIVGVIMDVETAW